MADDHGRQGGPRCIALVGPFGSGKTSLLEAILARTGAISRQGHVRDGNTVGDASPEARSNSMSVEANFADCQYLGERYTFIDCPGSVEFQYEAAPVLNGVDLAIVVAEADPKKVPALQLVLRDAAVLPELQETLRPFTEYIQAIAGDLAASWSLGKPGVELRAAASLAVNFSTWRTLADSGVDPDEAAELVAVMVAAVAKSQAAEQ